MASDRWTPDVCEAWLDALADKTSHDVATDQLRALLLTALDALKAQPRWVAVEDFDPEAMLAVAESTSMQGEGKPFRILVVPLPLPPLPEEDA